MLSLIFFLVVASAVLVSCCNADACPLYLAPSRVKGGGKGIFVGTKVKVGNGVAQSEGLIIDDYLVQGETTAAVSFFFIINLMHM